MALYRRIQTTFWTDTKVVDDFTPEDKYFYLYLFTNPHTNLCGCYEISIKQMANETGYSKDTVERLLERFRNIHKVVDYSNGTKELLLVNWHKYNWTKSPKYRKSLNEEINDVKNDDFKHYLECLYNSIDTVSIQYQYGIDTITNTNTNTIANAITITNADSENEEESDDYDLEDAWKKIRDLYPQNRKNSFQMGKLKFLDMFRGVFNRRALVITIARAIDLYKKDCEEQGDENFKYVPNMDKWFEECSGYWIEQAEEYERSKNDNTTQSDE